MKYTFLCLYVTMVLCCCGANAQNALYLSQGRIEFEKKLHVHALLNESDSWTENMKKFVPKFRITYHSLLFRDQTTLFMPGKENPDNTDRMLEMPAEENVVYSLLDKQQYTGQKKFFDQLFLVKDSTRPIQWKITSETRNIAGFECRRANALILDSIYVVAYYTDAIVTPGGPESLNGLPGMILGLAVPHEHVTWFATKVYAEEIKDEQFKIPVKGKQITHAALGKTLQTLATQWGEQGKRVIVAAML